MRNYRQLRVSKRYQARKETYRLGDPTGIQIIHNWKLAGEKETNK